MLFVIIHLQPDQPWLEIINIKPIGLLFYKYNDSLCVLLNFE